ncbi:hypothetical protein [uncultured Sphingobacterium sp.]|uniref:hypothetical protein n=1 Tax=uncultured Sphingobacterium sp. TaxID=182688 RepID=UPI00374A0600
MILEETKVLHKKEFAWVVKILLFLTMVSCSTQRNFDDFTEIDRKNCSSFTQRGKGYTDGKIPPTVHGKIRFCDGNEKIPNANILFLKNGKDTVANLVADKNGEFSKKFNTEGFFGTIEIHSLLTNMTFNYVRIGANYKDYYLEMKLPKQLVYIEEIGPKQDQKKLRKEVERANRKR